MTQSFRIAVLLCAAGVLAASVAVAEPEPNHSTIQSQYIDLEGSAVGRPDDCSDLVCSDWLATIRDFSDAPIAGASVVIDFSNCPDIQISCDQLHSVTGQTRLTGKMVMGTTDAQGRVTFRIQGAANATSIAGSELSAGTNAGSPCARIYADGVLLASLFAVAYDVDGLGSPDAAVNGVDASIVAGEVAKVILGAQARERDDYNHSGSLTGADVSRAAAMAAQRLIGSGSVNTAPFCP